MSARKVLCQDTFYTLQDIATVSSGNSEITEKLNRIQFGVAPPPGQSYKITDAAIRSRLTPYIKSYEVKINVPENALISRNSIKISKDQIEGLLMSALQNSGRPGAYKAVSNVADIYLPAGSLSYKVEEIGMVKNSPVVSYRIDFMIDNRKEKSSSYTLQAGGASPDSSAFISGLPENQETLIPASALVPSTDNGQSGGNSLAAAQPIKPAVKNPDAGYDNYGEVIKRGHPVELVFSDKVPAILTTVACVPGPVNFQEQVYTPPTPVVTTVEQTKKTTVEPAPAEDPLYPEYNDPYGLFRNRRDVPTTMNKYEGSLWRGDSSFGNFIRDGRAQNPGDLLLVTDIQKLVTQFDEKPVAKDTTGDDVFLVGEADRLKVHKGINEMTVKVAAVNRSGLLAVYGERTEYKDSNNTRYRTILTGYIRPQDIADNNSINASKLQSFAFRTDRKIKITNELRQKIITDLEKISAVNNTTTQQATPSAQTLQTSTAPASTPGTNQAVPADPAAPADEEALF
ncbi:hypothetical protein CHS0354_026824 [Potamilus streckersoni]|uniref:Uncharacterized protein n=1 Tax=Potamilus streckersoni TaxID=2493646 RepID=A0AAE0T5S9_9BIVA|nr:hypothetical protein CHS0354_026824 [Potamilus streckersoni]